MHASFHFGGVVEPGAFADGQRVHIGAQGCDASRPASAQDGDDAGLRETAMLDAQLVQLALDQRGGFALFEPQFRPAMDGAPQRDDSLEQGLFDLDGHAVGVT